MTPEQIREVLAMSLVEQEVWCESPEHGSRGWGESLEQVAFRLRDEAVEYQGWGKALGDVCGYWCDQNETNISLGGFWIHKAKPIHWILAALKAKEMSR
jgi:hypothetical protein